MHFTSVNIFVSHSKYHWAKLIKLCHKINHWPKIIHTKKYIIYLFNYNKIKMTSLKLVIKTCHSNFIFFIIKINTEPKKIYIFFLNYYINDGLTGGDRHITIQYIIIIDF